jgi:hypothetical protein
MKRYIFILVLLITGLAHAQDSGSRGLLIDRNQFIVTWDIAFPSGDYLNETSLNGARLEYRKRLNRNFAWGLSAGWNSYRQNVGQQLYEAEDGSRAVFTDMVRKVNELPIAVSGYYFLDQTADFRPYAGLGLGTMYSQQKAFFNIYVIEENNWGFLVRPELGMQYDFNYNVGMHLYAAYSYASNKNEAFRIDNLQHISIGIGLVWSY